MKVLVGCEESQAVCKAFRELGHEAYSCDILPCSGGHPEWHLQMSVFDAIELHKWDMGIFFPPCTDIAVSGAAWFKKKREDGRQQASIEFFMKIVNCGINKMAIENPIGIMSNLYRKPDQIIHPYYFGDQFQKTTCLWLKNLPALYHNDKPNLFDSVVTHTSPGEMHIGLRKDGRIYKMAKWYNDARSGNHGHKRSKTFPGIARAMAEQWGGKINLHNT